jgi:hypothetical protein
MTRNKILDRLSLLTELLQQAAPYVTERPPSFILPRTRGRMKEGEDLVEAH